MDIYVLIGIIAGVIALTALIFYFVKRFKPSNEELEMVFDLSKIIYSLVEATLSVAKIFDKEELKKVSDIVYNTLGYIEEAVTNSIDEIDEEMAIAEGIEYAKELYIGVGYILTADKELIIDSTIRLTFFMYKSLNK